MPTAHKAYCDSHVAAVGRLQLRTPSIAVAWGVPCAAGWRCPVVQQDGGALLGWALLALQMQRAIRIHMMTTMEFTFQPVLHMRTIYYWIRRRCAHYCFSIRLSCQMRLFHLYNGLLAELLKRLAEPQWKRQARHSGESTTHVQVQ